MVTKHALSKLAEIPMQHGTLCIDRCPRILNRLFQFDYKYISFIFSAGLIRRLHVKSSNNTTSKCQQASTGNQLVDSEQFTGNSKDTDPAGDLLRDLPEWLGDFTEHHVDEGVSASRDTPASTSCESDS